MYRVSTIISAMEKTKVGKKGGGGRGESEVGCNSK